MGNAKAIRYRLKATIRMGTHANSYLTNALPSSQGPKIFYGQAKSARTFTSDQLEDERWKVITGPNQEFFTREEAE